MRAKLFLTILAVVLVTLLALVALSYVHEGIDASIYYYSNYDEAMTGRTSLSERWPEFLPKTVKEIHHEIRTEPSGTWMKFTFTDDESGTMRLGARQLTIDEIKMIELRKPSRVDWWFEELKQVDPEDESAIEAELYVREGECKLNPELQNTFFLIDEINHTAYLWCDKELPLAK